MPLHPSTLEMRLDADGRPALAAVVRPEDPAAAVWSGTPYPAHVLVRWDGSALFTAEGEKMRGVLDALDADPAGAAQQIGKACGRCMWCHQQLTLESSQEAGVGPVCASKYGGRISIGQRGGAGDIANLDTHAAAAVAAAVRVPAGEVLQVSAALVAASPVLSEMLRDLSSDAVGESEAEGEASGEVPQLLLDTALLDSELLAQLHAFVTASVPPPRAADAARALDFLGAKTHLQSLFELMAFAKSCLVIHDFENEAF